MVRMRTGAAVVTAAGLLLAGAAGGAVAGHKVTSAQIKNNTIKSKDIHNHTIRGEDVHAKAIGAGKLSAGVRAAMRTRAQVYQLPAATTSSGYGAQITGLPMGVYQVGYSMGIDVAANTPNVDCWVEIETPGGDDRHAISSGSPGGGGNNYVTVSGSGVIDTRGGPSSLFVGCQTGDYSAFSVLQTSSRFYAIPVNALAEHTATLE